jgi:hypothetical protein
MATINAINSNIPIEITKGGTAAITFTSNGVLLGNTTSAITATTAGSNGQILIGATSAAPAFATLTSTGGTISYTTGANTLNLEAVAGASGLPWTVVTGTSQAISVNNGYIANNAGLVTLTLPASATVGQTIEVTGINNATGWKIAQNANQVIHFGSSNTTTGTGGSLASTATRDAVRLVCVIAGASTEYNVLSAQGNITVV